MNRRRFLSTTSKTLMAATGAISLRAFAAGNNPLVFRIDPEHRVTDIPQDVIGLSYESTQLGNPDYFAPTNTNLIALFRTLSLSGSLRLGGNTSEFTYFKSRQDTPSPAWSPKSTQPKELTPITPQALRNLRGFLDRTGWNCIYGLNLGTSTPERAVEEAAAAIEILGPKLQYMQIGNEPNNYIRYKLRGNTWNEQAYLGEWVTFARAIIKRTPRARFAGPDMGAEYRWMQAFAKEAVLQLGTNLVAMSDHFYAAGPPTNPEVTLAALLSETGKIGHEMGVMHEAGQLSKLPYRMTEVNSCYLGGKPGMSDTFGSALWAGDLTLNLVTHGFCGVNFHGGGGRQIRASLGGEMPGDSVAKAAADDSYYTPIAGNLESGFSARPIFYGMKLAEQLAGQILLASDSSGLKPEIAAYPALCRNERAMKAVLFNKGPEEQEIVVVTKRPLKHADALRLAAPALTALVGVSFGRAVVDTDGTLTTAKGENLRCRSKDSFEIVLPPYSAALVTAKW